MMSKREPLPVRPRAREVEIDKIRRCWRVRDLAIPRLACGAAALAISRPWSHQSGIASVWPVAEVLGRPPRTLRQYVVGDDTALCIDQPIDKPRTSTNSRLQLDPLHVAVDGRQGGTQDGGLGTQLRSVDAEATSVIGVD